MLSDGSCRIIPLPNVCAEACSHDCFEGRCTCPQDMYLDSSDQSTCKHINDVDQVRNLNLISKTKFLPFTLLSDYIFVLGNFD